MKTIYKYTVSLRNNCVEMPANAELLHFAKQGHSYFVWARVETDQPLCERSIQVVGTGWSPADGVYIGTIHDEGFVWHAFDLGQEPIA